jgi:hypothetical protein
MTRMPWSGLLLVLLIGMTASCGMKRRNEGVIYPPIKVHVENQNFYDATVYLRWQGNRRRLGVTGGHGTESFTADWLGPEVTLEIALLAGQRYRGNTIGISPGDELVVVIPVDPGRFHVYRRDP